MSLQFTRTWKYVELSLENELVEYVMTEHDILLCHWLHWSQMMFKAGHISASPEECVDDFIVVNWCWEVK
jgi:hypothetical protein